MELSFLTNPVGVVLVLALRVYPTLLEASK